VLYLRLALIVEMRAERHEVAIGYPVAFWNISR
jgi:hypothetical protein